MADPLMPFVSNIGMEGEPFVDKGLALGYGTFYYAGDGAGVSAVVGGVDTTLDHGIVGLPAAILSNYGGTP